jgi:hypothetical protein
MQIHLRDWFWFATVVGLALSWSLHSQASADSYERRWWRSVEREVSLNLENEALRARLSDFTDALKSDRSELRALKIKCGEKIGYQCGTQFP